MSFKLQTVGRACEDEVNRLDRIKSKIRYGYAVAQFDRFKSMLSLPVEQIPCMVDPEDYHQEPFGFRYSGVYFEFYPAVDHYDDVKIEWVGENHNAACCSMGSFDGCYVDTDDDRKLTLIVDDETLQTLSRNYQFVIGPDPETTFIRYFERWVEAQKVALSTRSRENATCWETAKDEWVEEVKRLHKLRTKKDAN